MKRIFHVVGARPNFMKVAPVYRALSTCAVQRIIHTGQHYHDAMSAVFFTDLELAPPDENLEVGSATHAVQTAEVMTRLEPVLLNFRPNLVMVYGDVNSTMAASIVSSKLLIPVAHVEAGLRSGDRTMPEELNRRVTDVIADLLFTPSEDADRNLLAEGVPAEKIHLVGNVMIDTLVRLLPKANSEKMRARLGLDHQPYVLVTLHRPSNVDQADVLKELLEALGSIARRVPVVFPVHPRTAARIAAHSLPAASNIRLIEPLGYLEFLALQKEAAVVITDSGGVQEETTFLGVPCITVRENTERPITITEGTNVLLGRSAEPLRTHVDLALGGGWRTGRIPALWDGRAGERIAQIVMAS